MPNTKKTRCWHCIRRHIQLLIVNEAKGLKDKKAAWLQRNLVQLFYLLRIKISQNLLLT